MKLSDLSFVLLWVLLTQATLAQEQLGLKLDVYAGFTQNLMNPASSGYSPSDWDVFLGGGYFFVNNDYAYLANSSLINMIKTGFSNMEITDTETIETPSNNNEYLLRYSDKKNDKYVSIFAAGLGPAVRFRFGESHVLGAFITYRMGIASQNVPEPFTYEIYNAIPKHQPFEVEEVSAAAMSWRSVGLHYSYTEFPDNESQLSIGTNLKFNTGYDAIYFMSHGQSILEKASDSTYMTQSDVEFAFTSTNGANRSFSLKKSGGGISIDLGIKIGQRFEDGYGWHAGFSLIDLGFVSFSRNSEKHRIPAGNVFAVPHQIFDEQDLSTVAKSISHEVYGDSTTTFSGRNFVIWTPAALGIQWGYQLPQKIHFDGILMQRIPMPGATIKRNNLLAFTASYQSQWVTLGLPLSVLNYKYLHAGLFLRMGFLHLGSDDILSIFKETNFTGTDFYIGIKINPVELKKKNKRKGPPVKCFKF